ncbi:O-antigen ligase family protein [uncultured Tenacibaculum sp.]|uniref:O-antigen ligase family protein n=1 Tax=uncultured Tenacibaculum sp. TaxID=174713 RepID=UPI0026030D78|nr:O-antigen ligase family protein [uncultured Tenacibaculum sp.]
MDKKLNVIKEYTLYILFFFLPSWRLIQNITLVLLLLLPPYNLKLKNKFLIGTPLFFLFYLILNALFQGKINIEISNITKLLPLVLLPIAFEKVSFDKIINALFVLLIGTLVMQLMSIYGIISYLTSDGIKYELTNYGKLNDVLGFERPYIGYFSAINILISYIFLKRRRHWFFIITGLISITLIIYLSTRLAALISGIFILFFLWKELKNFKLKLVILGSFFTFIILALVTFNSSLKKRFSLIKKDPRTIIWKGSIKQIIDTKSYMFGNASLKETRSNQLQYYREYDQFGNSDIKDRFIKRNYNTHNQFLNELVRGGILGLILFLIPIFMSFILNLKSKNYINILLILSVTMFLIVENLLARQIGIYILSIILAITIFNHKISYFDIKQN